MKIKILLILGIGLLFGCNNIDYMPKYFDYENDLEKEKLIKKVKSLEQYKANIIDFETEKTENPIIEFRKEFTEKGNVSYQVYYDIFGNEKQLTTNKYNKNDFLIEVISENILNNSKSIEELKYDTIINKQISLHTIYNDTINYFVFFKYDKDKNIITATDIQNGDTTLNKFDYKFNENGKILIKKVNQQGDFGETEYITENDYDENGNLVMRIFKSEFVKENKTEYKYNDENRIELIAEYDEGLTIKETFYDKYFNPILICNYIDGKLNNQFKYKYTFDKVGNWIEKKVFVKQHTDNQNSWKFIFIETRNIEYYM